MQLIEDPLLVSHRLGCQIPVWSGAAGAAKRSPSQSAERSPGLGGKPASALSASPHILFPRIAIFAWGDDWTLLDANCRAVLFEARDELHPSSFTFARRGSRSISLRWGSAGRSLAWMLHPYPDKYPAMRRSSCLVYSEFPCSAFCVVRSSCFTPDCVRFSLFQVGCRVCCSREAFSAPSAHFLPCEPSLRICHRPLRSAPWHPGQIAAENVDAKRRGHQKRSDPEAPVMVHSPPIRARIGLASFPAVSFGIVLVSGHFFSISHGFRRRAQTGCSASSQSECEFRARSALCLFAVPDILLLLRHDYYLAAWGAEDGQLWPGWVRGSRNLSMARI